MRRRAILLVVLFLAPVATAIPPSPAAWSPYNAASAITDLALAAEGFTLAASLDRPVDPGACDPVANPTGCANQAPTAGDLAILDAGSGFAYYGSGATVTGPTGATAPQGRSSVAVSRDGSTIASVGLDTNPTGGPQEQTATSPKLYYQRVGGDARWRFDSPATNVSFFLATTGEPHQVLLSSDGTRVVVSWNDAESYRVKGYRFASGSLTEQFSFTRPGAVFDLAATSDLGSVLIAGRIVESNETHGILHRLSFEGTEMQTLYERSFNGSVLRSAAIAPDGRIFAGDTRGRLLYSYRTNDFATMDLPASTGNSTIELSGDGTRLAVRASGGALVLLDVTTFPRIVWNATLAGDVVDLALNRTGGTLLAAVNGTSGGVFGFGENSSAPLWTFSGATQRVAVNDAGTRAAYSQGGAVTALEVPRGIEFAFPGGSHRSAPIPFKAEGAAVFEVNVNNTGAGPELVSFETPKGLDLTVVAEPQSLSVGPGETKKVSFTATAGKSFVGTHTFNVTARAITSGAVDNVTVTLTPITVTNVSLVLNGTSEVTVLPGQRTDIVLGVLNRGTGNAAIGIKATQQPSQGGAWNVTLDQPSFQVAPGTQTTVRVSVIPPEDVVNGTFNTVTFALEGPEVADSAQIVFRINPTLLVEISASGRVKFVEPASAAYYNVTITNTGSLPRRFEAFFQATPTGGKNWAVDMDTSPHLLVPGGSTTILVRIFAPVDAVPNTDRVSVFVTARSIPEFDNETIATSNLTLFANAVPPKPTTTTPAGITIPGFAPLAALAAFAILALVLPTRRRHP